MVFCFSWHIMVPMETKKKKIIIGIAIVILIALCTYILWPSAPAASPEDGIPSQSETGQNTPAETPAGAEGSASNVGSSTEAPFNAAMNAARKAFGQKDYASSLKYYQEALSYRNSDTVFAGMYTVFTAQQDWKRAAAAVDGAIAANPLFVDYWKWKIGLMDERTAASYADLKKVYEEGLGKVDAKYKVNLVTYFAGVSESNLEKAEAVKLWQYAETVYPQNNAVYQAEIARIQGTM